MRENQTAILAGLCLILIQIACVPAAVAQRQSLHNFQWNWQNSQELPATESLAKANIPQSDKNEIAAAIAARLRLDDDTSSDRQLYNAALDTRVKFIDLNHDGVPEVVAQPLADCSPTGNCSIWVFQKQNHGYRMLLNGFGQTFTIQKSRTNGYDDVVLAAHSSAFDSGLTVFQYRHGAYADTACYNATWRILQGDSYVDLKEPHITPCR